MKDLEEENRRLKQMYVNLSLEHTILKGIIEKKALKPAEKRELVDYAITTHQTSLRTACKVVGISRSSYAYEPDTTRDQVVIEAL